MPRAAVERRIADARALRLNNIAVAHRTPTWNPSYFISTGG